MRRSFFPRGFLSLLSIALLLSGSSLYLFNRFRFDGASAPYERVEAVCYNRTTSARYAKVYDALEEASSGDTIYCIPGSSSLETRTLTIPSGVSLSLPYDGEKHYSTQEDLEALKEAGKTSLIDTNASRVQANRVFQLQMNLGADIRVESGGSLLVGGEYYTRGCVGKYAEITLGEGSSIEVDGIFECFGYVKEDAGDAVNPRSAIPSQAQEGETYPEDGEGCTDNSIDEGRLITLSAGSVTKTYMAMQDALSGGTLSTAVMAGDNCPFWTYDFPALQTYVQVMSGASMSADAVMVAGTIVGRGLADIVVPQGQEGMFSLSSGYLSLEYVPANVLYTSGTNSFTNVAIHGTTEFLSISVSVSGMTLDSSKFFVPINYKWRAYVEDGSTFRIRNPLKFLNESYMEIREGGLLEIDAPTIFYTPQAVDLSGTTASYTHNSAPSQLFNNGTLRVLSGGSLGGYVEHENVSGTGLIDLSQAGPNSLSVSAIEDKDGNEVSVSSTANYRDEGSSGIASLVPGGTYQSDYLEGDAYPYAWTGNFSLTGTLSVTVSDVDYMYPLRYFTVYVNDEQSATGAEVLAENASQDVTFTDISLGQYVRIVAPDVAEVRVKVSGEEIPYSPDSWYLMSSSIEVTIVPSEGTKVAMATTALAHRYYTDISPANEGGEKYVTDNSVDIGANLSSDSGRGSTKCFIYSSATSTGTYSEVASGSAGSTWVILKKGSYFRLSGSGGIGSNGMLEFTGKYYRYDLNGEVGSGEVLTGFDPADGGANSDPVFETGTSDRVVLTFGMTRGICFGAGTRILLADGTEKMIEDIGETDVLMTYDFLSGGFRPSPLFYKVRHEYGMKEIIEVRLSDGETIDISGFHGFFDYDERKFFDISSENADSMVGRRILAYDHGRIGDPVTIVGVSRRIEKGYVYSIASEKNLNVVANGMLTVLPPFAIDGFGNYFDVTESFRWDARDMEEKIDAFGLFPYEGLAEQFLSRGMYEAMNAQYFSVGLGLGWIDESDLTHWASYFVEMMSDGELTMADRFYQ